MPTFFEASACISEEQVERIAHFEAVAAYCLQVAADPICQNPEVALRVAEQAQQDAARLLLTEVRADQMLIQGSVVRVGYQVQDRADGLTLTTIRAEVADPKHAQGRYARTTLAASQRPGGLIDEFAYIAAPDIPGEITVIPLFDPRSGILAQIGNRLAGSFGINRGTVAVRDFQKRAGNVDAVRDQVVGETIARFQTAARRANASEPDSDEVAAAAQAQIDRAEAQRELDLQVLKERVQNEIVELNAIGDYALSHNLSDPEARALTTQAEANFAWGSAPGFEKKKDPPPHVSMGNRVWG